MQTEGWGQTYDEGTIIHIDRDHQSKNGPFTIINIRDKITNEIKRIQVWEQAYRDIKNEVYYIGSNVSIPGYVHYYVDKNDNKQVRVKTKHIFPQGGRIKIRLKVTSECYKGESLESGIWAFSGKPFVGNEKISDTLVVRCFMPNTSILWRKVKKGSFIEVDGIYQILEDNIGSRITISNVFHIEEIRDV